MAVLKHWLSKATYLLWQARHMLHVREEQLQSFAEEYDI